MQPQYPMTQPPVPHTETQAVTYKGKSAYQHGLTHMQQQGWQQQNLAVSDNRTGCMRFLMLGGIGALVFKPKQNYLVTFARTI